MHTLEQLRSGALAGIRRLDLSANLTHFPPEIFALADSLEILNLSHNALCELPPELPRLKKLQVFFASHNRFTHLPEVLGQCPQLSQVGLRNNQIRHLPAAALPPRLRWLTLTDNALTQLPPELGQCPQLEKLMLAGNQLRTLPPSLAELPALALLRVAANQLEALPGWLWEMPALAWLAPAGNPWCEEALAAPADALGHADAGTPSDAPIHAPTIAWAELTLGEVLGEGASGITHQALWQPPGGAARSVAVKLFKGKLTSDGLPASERAACLAAGPHASLTSALGQLIGHPDGQDGLVMPLLPAHLQALAGPPSLASCSRDEYASATTFSPATALRLLQDSAQALAHLHAHGVVHGDFYAHNILWRPQTGQAVLSDFGAALRWPSAHPATWVPAQKLEVLAFGHLLAEVLARTSAASSAATPSTLAALQHWQTQCAQTVPARRPLMAQVAAALAALPV